MGFCRICGSIVHGARCAKCGGSAVAGTVQVGERGKELSSDRWMQTYTSKSPVMPSSAVAVPTSQTSELPSADLKKLRRHSAFPRPINTRLDTTTTRLDTKVSAHIAASTTATSPVRNSSTFDVENLPASAGVLAAPDVFGTTQLSKVYGSVLQPRETLATHACAECNAIFQPDSTIFPSPSSSSSSNPSFVCKACFIEHGGSKGVCAKCSKTVYGVKSLDGGGFVESAGSVWHGACFTCASCHADVSRTPAVDLLGRPTCAECFESCLKPGRRTPGTTPVKRGRTTSTTTTPSAKEMKEQASPMFDELHSKLGLPARSREGTPSRETESQQSPSVRERTISARLTSPLGAGVGSNNMHRARSSGSLPTVDLGSPPHETTPTRTRTRTISKGYSPNPSPGPSPVRPNNLFGTWRGSDAGGSPTRRDASPSPNPSPGTSPSPHRFPSLAPDARSKPLSHQSSSGSLTFPSSSTSSPPTANTDLADTATCLTCHQPLFRVSGGGRIVRLGAGEAYHASCFRCGVCHDTFEEDRDGSGQAVFVRAPGIGAVHIECAPPEKVVIRPLVPKPKAQTNESPKSQSFAAHKARAQSVDIKMFGIANGPFGTIRGNPDLSASTSTNNTDTIRGIKSPSSSDLSLSGTTFKSPTDPISSNTTLSKATGGRLACPGCSISVVPMERGVVPGPSGSRWHVGCLVCGGKATASAGVWGIGFGGDGYGTVRARSKSVSGSVVAAKREREEGKVGCGKKLDSAARCDDVGIPYCRECWMALPRAEITPPVSPTVTGSGPNGWTRTGVPRQMTGASLSLSIAAASSSTPTLVHTPTGCGSFPLSPSMSTSSASTTSISASLSQLSLSRQDTGSSASPSLSASSSSGIPSVDSHIGGGGGLMRSPTLTQHSGPVKQLGVTHTLSMRADRPGRPRPKSLQVFGPLGLGGVKTKGAYLSRQMTGGRGGGGEPGAEDDV